MQDNQLSLIVNQAGLAENKSKQLLQSFGDLFNDARQTVKFAKDIVVTDVSQVEEMRKARETRLELKSTRVKVENTRKELKEQGLREGKAIDGIANVIKALIVPVEEYLENQEKFAERIEAERKNKIEAERVSQLLKYVEEAESYSLHPDKMSQDTFDKLLENSKLAFEARKKAEADAEAERLAKIEAEKAEQERIKQENAKLKAEAEAREKELAIEREKIRKENEKREAQLAKERAEQQAKLDAERKAREQAEAKIEAERKLQEEKLKAEAEKERQSLLAPDKEKLMVLANTLVLIEIPAVKSNEAQQVVNELQLQLEKLANEIRNKASKL